MVVVGQKQNNDCTDCIDLGRVLKDRGQLREQTDMKFQPSQQNSNLGTLKIKYGQTTFSINKVTKIGESTINKKTLYTYKLADKKLNGKTISLHISANVKGFTTVYDANAIKNQTTDPKTGERYIADSQLLMNIQKERNGNIKLILRDGSSYSINSDGQLTSVDKNNGSQGQKNSNSQTNIKGRIA
jgi:hypothetical protein